MWRFMEEKLRIEPPAEKVWRPLFNEYNQTVKALRCVPESSCGEDIGDHYWSFPTLVICVPETVSRQTLRMS